MRFFSPIGPLLRGWLISFLVIGVLALVMVGQFALAVSMPVSEALRMAVRDWLPWAILAPLLFRFVSRCPLGPRTWKRTGPLHVLGAALTFLFTMVWADVLFPPQRPSAIFKDGGPPRHQRDFSPGEPGLPPGDQRNEGGHNRPPMPPGGHGWGGSFVFFMGFRFPIYLAMISIAHAVYFYRGSQEREKRTLGLEASLAKSRLEALRMQLQPHFLFNSLNAIAELVHKNPDAADEMLVALSRLLRMALDTSGEQEWPLSRELEFMDRYLAIERVRLGERLLVEVNVQEDARAGLVPVFLLQPIVENAIRHGLEPEADLGILRVKGERRGEKLIFAISDNGPGLPVDRELREGIGLANTRARLFELYGKAAQFNLKNENGLSVEIEIPFKPS